MNQDVQILQKKCEIVALMINYSNFFLTYVKIQFVFCSSYDLLSANIYC